MSTAPAIPDSQSIFGLETDPPAPRVDKGDPTESNPQMGKPEDALDANGLKKSDRENLMTIRRMYLEKWSMQRRIMVRNILRKMEYFKGNQYYVIGPDGFTFQDPFASSGGDGTQQGSDSQDYYRYVTNIIQWFEKILVSTLSASIPAIRFQPSNAQSDIGNRVAQNASRANAYIERLNDEKGLLEQKISYLGLAGSYFVYTRPVRDARLSGGKTEAKTTETMQDRQVKPDRYACQNCGGETPLDQMAVESKMNCKFCSQPVSEADFYPSMTIPMPVISAAEDVPPVQVRKSIYNGLHVAAAHNADSESGDPVTKTPFLDLSLEVDLGGLRAMYPDMWLQLAGGGDASGSGDNEVDRQARLQQYTQNNGAAWWTRSSDLTQGQMPTYSRTWLQPEAFNILDKKEDADRLAGVFPDGCCVASWGGQFLDIRKAKLAEEWTWGGTHRGFGLYPPAILDPAMDFQDRLNDAGNTESEYYDRLAVPPIAYDSKAIAGKGLNGKYWPPGAWFPVAVKPKEGRKLQDILFQPKFTMDAGIKDYQQRLVLMAQMVVGVTPQTYGGSQEHIDTASGQAQALKTAMGILWLYWSQVRSESARTALNAIKCLAENATEEVFDVIKGDDNRFRNEPIDLQALKNEIDAYPEEEQGFPESREQMAERFETLITSAAKNPLIMEMLGPMKNRRIAVRTLLPQDMEIPEEKARIKILEDISRLMRGTATPQQDPATGQVVMMPSVVPDPNLKSILAITPDTVEEYVTDNYWQLKEQTRPQFDNIMAYLALAVEYQTRNAIAAAGPTGIPAPGGGPPTSGASSPTGPSQAAA